jgi:NTP pyrophosphatase (non-canonical NTP hydrolase)
MHTINVLETQQTISKWANETFGPVGSNQRVAIRANEEMAELLRTLSIDDNDAEKAIEEVADIFIVLYRLVDRMGGDVHAAIDKKMMINRQRRWHLDGSGCERHIRDKWRDEELAVIANAPGDRL